MARILVVCSMSLLMIFLGGCPPPQPHPPALPAEPLQMDAGPSVLAPITEVDEAREPDLVNAALAPDAGAIPSPSDWAQWQPHPASTPPPAGAAPIPASPPVPPATIVQQANKAARVTPSAAGYAENQSVVQEYPYTPGSLYEVYTSPNHPTSILLPLGDTLAAAPLLSPDAWDVTRIQAGEGPQRQDGFIIRPLRAGLEATISLFTHNGLRFFVALKSFEKTSMVAVTWRVPAQHRPPVLPPVALQAPPAPLAPPLVDLRRLHTLYTVVYERQAPPPFVPLAVFDDGQVTVIQFKEALTFTAAPVVFAAHADGSQGVVQFTLYTKPGVPTDGMYYLIQGLWPKLTLKGQDGYELTIVRQRPIPQPYVPHPGALR